MKNPDKRNLVAIASHFRNGGVMSKRKRDKRRADRQAARRAIRDQKD